MNQNHQIVERATPIEFDCDQHAEGGWVDHADFRMTLEEFVLYHQKALAKFARWWAQNGQPQLQEPEHWQNYLCDYCDAQSQYNVSSWPLEPEFGMDLPDASEL